MDVEFGSIELENPLLHLLNVVDEKGNRDNKKSVCETNLFKTFSTNSNANHIRELHINDVCEIPELLFC